MSISLQIEQMTLEEKLLAMEKLWEELSRQETDVPMPQWQCETLDNRELLLKEGKAGFSDWETAKARLSQQTP
jgi:hypothetical protein